MTKIMFNIIITFNINSKNNHAKVNLPTGNYKPTNNKVHVIM